MLKKRAFIYIYFLFFEKVWKSWKNRNYLHKIFITIYSISVILGTKSSWFDVSSVNYKPIGRFPQVFVVFLECLNFKFHVRNAGLHGGQISICLPLQPYPKQTNKYITNHNFRTIFDKTGHILSFEWCTILHHPLKK